MMNTSSPYRYRCAVTSLFLIAVASVLLTSSALAIEPVMSPIEAESIWDGEYKKGRVIAFPPIGKELDPKMLKLLEALEEKRAEQAKKEAADPPTDTPSDSAAKPPALSAPVGREAFLDVTYERADGQPVFVLVQRFKDAAALEAYWQANATDDWTVGEEDGAPVFTYREGEGEESGYRNKTAHLGRYMLGAKQLHAGEDYLLAFDAYRAQVKALP